MRPGTIRHPESKKACAAEPRRPLTGKPVQLASVMVTLVSP